MANKEDKTQQLAVAQQQNQSLVFDTIEHFNNAQRMCMCLATANMLPKHFQGEGNLGNCMLALEIAQRGQRPIMEVFQNLYIVNGKSAWSASYLIGRVNTSGRFSSLRWESQGDGTANWRMRARAVELATGEELFGTWVSLDMAKKFQWGDMWNKMPEQMLRYRAAAFWVRLYCPDIAMGIPMADEIEDVKFEDVTPVNGEEGEKKNAAAIAALQQAIGTKKKPEAEAPANEPPVDKSESVAEMPTPVVQIKVETAPKPKSESYEATLERAKRNLGIPTNAQESSEINFESSEQ